MAEEAPREVMATADVEARSETTPQPAGISSRLGTLLVVVTGLLVITLTPTITYFVIRSAAQPRVPDVAPAASETRAGALPSGAGMLELNPILVNIAQTKATRILKLQVQLVVSDATLADDLKAQALPLLTDRVIQVARRKTLEDLEGTQGTDALKRDILSELNAVLKDRGAIVDIYFKEFLIQ